MRITSVILIFAFLVVSCNNSKEQKKPVKKESPKTSTESQKQETGWEDIMPSVVEIDSYDGNRILESGQGFFVAEDLIATKYSLVNQADNVKFSPLDTEEKFTATKYVAVDRINDIVILKTEGIKRKPIELYSGTAPNTAKTSYISLSPAKTIQLFTGKLLNLATVKGTKIYRITNRIRKNTFGTPILVSNKKAIGLAFSDVVNYQQQSFAIPSFFIANLLSNKLKRARSLESLRSFSSAEAAAENKKIKALVLKTDLGDITIRLFNETPQYRDNFVGLVKENFYDSLLIHRVITDFGIQTGAADTRYAEEGDIVGWKGPGYTIPSHIVPELYHKRGMIGSPRKPDTKNRRRRSDGSQFYIVTGRKYFDAELDEIEEQNNINFTPQQREAYKTVGGAPHLDGSYTIFGEVISGMEVADSIVRVETDKKWRPVEDIRLNDIKIIK